MENVYIVEIIVDDYMTVNLKIPKKLDAMELKALMVKANKLFNLSEAKIVEKPTKEKSIKKKTNRRCTIDIERQKQLCIIWYTQEDKRDDVCEEFGLNRKETAAKMWYLKTRYFDGDVGNASPKKVSEKNEKSEKWNKHDVNELVDLVEKGHDMDFISRYLNKDKKVVEEKIYDLKNRGVLE